MKAKHSPGPLTATKMTQDREDAQYRVESNYFSIEGEWRDNYVSFCGYFGSYGPNVFSVAPEMLTELQAARNELWACLHNIRIDLHKGNQAWEGVPELLEKRLTAIDALIAKATGAAP